MSQQNSSQQAATTTLDDGSVIGPDGNARCWWCNSTDVYRHYHDTDWGKPVRDDSRLFEKLTLEGAQAGLSWATILNKMPGYRAAFAEWNIAAIAAFTPEDVERLLGDAGIVRHRGKIEATINNAQRALEMQAAGLTLADYFWSFEPPMSERPTEMTKTALLEVGSSAASTRLSKNLKKRGWKFVGPTTVYAFMQSAGIVNDHLANCWQR